MKKYVQYSLSIALILEAGVPQLAFAQGPAPTVGVVAGAGGSSRYLSAGTYEINNIEGNVTGGITDSVKNNRDVQEKDRDYLIARAKVIGDGLRDLVSKKQAFISLGQQASTTTTVPLTQYLTQLNEINALMEKVRIDISEASLINSNTLPSTVMQVGTTKITTGPGSTINLTKEMQPFLDSLDKSATELSGVKFLTLTHKNAFISITQNALNPDLSRVPQMDEAEIAKATLEMQAKQGVSRGTQGQQQFLADQIVDAVKSYVTNVGTNEFLRSRNGNDYTYLAESYQSLEKFFFMRSYLRKKYGLQLGGIQPESYPTTPLNLEGIAYKEMLFPVIGALTKIRSQTARTDADLMAAYNNARQFVEFYDRALTPTLSADASAKRQAVRDQMAKQDAAAPDQAWYSKIASGVTSVYKQAGASFAGHDEIMAKKPVVLNDDQKNVTYNSDDTGLMSRISGGITFFTGQTSTTQALLAVMRLVVADLREEIMLSQGDWSAMQSYHSKRFMATSEQTNRTVKIMCDIDTTLSPAARASAKAFTNGAVACQAAPTGLLGQQNNGGTILTTFRNLISSYDTVEMKRAQDARNLRVLIAQSVAAQAQDGDKGDDTSLFSK